MPTRRKMLECAAAFNAAALFGAKSGSLQNSVIDESQAKLTRAPFGDVRVYFDGPTDELKSMTAGSLRLKPGMSPHPPHQHDEEEIMVITEGTGEIVVDGRTSKVGPGAMMYCGGGKVHGITNTGKTPLLFYYYKWKA